MMQLAMAKAQSRSKEYFNRAVPGPKLLVIDEIGYLPIGRDEANLFFNVVAKRYEQARWCSRATCRSRNGPAPSPTTRH